MARSWRRCPPSGDAIKRWSSSRAREMPQRVYEIARKSRRTRRSRQFVNQSFKKAAMSRRGTVPAKRRGARSQSPGSPSSASSLASSAYRKGLVRRGRSGAIPSTSASAAGRKARRLGAGVRILPLHGPPCLPGRVGMMACGRCNALPRRRHLRKERPGGTRLEDPRSGIKGQEIPRWPTSARSKRSFGKHSSLT